MELYIHERTILKIIRVQVQQKSIHMYRNLERPIDTKILAQVREISRLLIRIPVTRDCSLQLRWIVIELQGRI